ncbi:MAG: helix-turn-helix domain-containing protein [Ethanoligenens sp.]
MKSKGISSKSSTTDQINDQLPILKTIKQMSQLCGIGEGTLRYLVEKGEIDYVQVGNRKLLVVDAIWDWYERNKTSAGGL